MFSTVVAPSPPRTEGAICAVGLPPTEIQILQSLLQASFNALLRSVQFQQLIP